MPPKGQDSFDFAKEPEPQSLSFAERIRNGYLEMVGTETGRFSSLSPHEFLRANQYRSYVHDELIEVSVPGLRTARISVNDLNREQRRLLDRSPADFAERWGFDNTTFGAFMRGEAVPISELSFDLRDERVGRMVVDIRGGGCTVDVDLQTLRPLMYNARHRRWVTVDTQHVRVPPNIRTRMPHPRECRECDWLAVAIEDYQRRNPAQGWFRFDWRL